MIKSSISQADRVELWSFMCYQLGQRGVCVFVGERGSGPARTDVGHVSQTGIIREC